MSGRAKRTRQGAIHRVNLTPREGEIYKLVLEGETSRSIAQRVGISSRTVQFHCSKILHKLGVRSRSELLAKMLARFL